MTDETMARVELLLTLVRMLNFVRKAAGAFDGSLTATDPHVYCTQVLADLSREGKTLVEALEKV